MTISVERQYPLVSVTEWDYSELADDVATNVTRLPPGAVVLQVGAFVDTADNNAGAVTLDVGDGDAGALYVTDLDAKTVGESEMADVTEIGKKYANGGYITATRKVTGAAASTAGKVRIFVSYAIIGRSNEVQQ